MSIPSSDIITAMEGLLSIAADTTRLKILYSIPKT